MSKIKYTEEMKQKSIELRIEGKSNPEITAITGIKHESLNKLFKERNVKLTEEQASNARARRWLNHEPTKDGMKICSKCNKNLSLDDFHNNKNTISGKVSACKSCYGEFYEENAEEIKRRVKIYADSHREEKRATDKIYYESHKENYIRNAAKWDSQNPEKRREITNSYGKRNQPKKNARSAMYRAKKIQATPPWISQDQIDEIRRIYENCPKGFHVDHIIPLNGENISGLHLPWNLQYLPAIENLKKSNKLK